MASARALKLKIQITCGSEIAMGPGKADLLEAIIAKGSISGAGRYLGMSYRRTWQLVDVMNRCWEEPLVETSPGSSHGGGARVTQFGTSVLARYRTLQATLDEAARGRDFAVLFAALREAPKASQKDADA